MPDITELAQREKFEAWAEEAGALPWGILKKHRNQDGNYPGPHYTYMWKAWQAASAEMVEALEKSEKTSEARREAIDRTHNMFVRERDRANAAEEALEKAQQQMTESENRVRKQNRHICELFDDNTALRQRIAGLEARTVNLPEPEQWDITQVLLCKKKVVAAIRAAGIKVEDE